MEKLFAFILYTFGAVFNTAPNTPTMRRYGLAFGKFTYAIAAVNFIVGDDVVVNFYNCIKKKERRKKRKYRVKRRHRDFLNTTNKKIFIDINKAKKNEEKIKKALFIEKNDQKNNRRKRRRKNAVVKTTNNRRSTLRSQSLAWPYRAHCLGNVVPPPTRYATFYCQIRMRAEKKYRYEKIFN